MAKYLGHEYLFKSLDDIRWMYDIDEMTLKNNGAAIALGMTGGNRMLQTINTTRYGIEHTGIITGGVIGGYNHDERTACQKPRFGLNTYSDKLHYDFDQKLLDKYGTQETFVLNTRGFLGIQASYMTRHNYIEANAPSGDVDFLEDVMSIPFAYRQKSELYLKWIEAKYPDAAKFGWEKWGGIQPKKSHIFFRKVKTTQRLLHGYLCRLFHAADPHSMNPMDYWYKRDGKLQAYYQEMYETRIGNTALPKELAEDMKMLYQTGNFTDKSLVLTVLSAVNNYFN
jgi:asparagine synthase (glutamine-hydrolysing)